MDHYEPPETAAPRPRRSSSAATRRPNRPAAAQQSGTRPRRNPQQPARRRRRRPTPVRSLAICAAVIFLMGFLMGFLFRGCTQPKEKPEESKPKASSTPPPETTLPKETDAPAPLVDLSDWRLVLVNSKTALPDDFAVSLTQLANGLSVDKRCYSDLQAMLTDCRAAGLSPVVASAYRTREEQTELYESKVRRLQGEGMDEEKARQEAAKVVAVPGTSEHHLGLAVDIVDQSYQLLDEGQAKTEVQKWLMEHCWDYGFILRYPVNKTDVTGIIYEPWHYRYVGKDYAASIKASGLCFEEWLARQQ